MKVTDIRTYRAPTVQEALAMVRRDLGPGASVLHTREVRGGGLLRWLSGQRLIEVVASTQVAVPSKLRSQQPIAAAPTRPTASVVAEHARRATAARRTPSHDGLDLLAHFDASSSRGQQAPGVVADGAHAAGQALFQLFTDLIEADVNEELARHWIDRLKQHAPGDRLDDPAELKLELAEIIESELPVAGPIRLSAGRRLVALVGPTGVGKTTTIAKLAANFRLREKRRVGLITVDTYRIAAVEQLRTYADIIDLPMEIVSTPREMHQAVARMADLDLILMDTAGRSPRDDVQIQELKSMLAEAMPDEVHLVLSSVASAKSLAKTAEQFAPVGTTALVLTKLDEAASLGNLLPLARSCRLPLSYLTHGQNVPDDIAPADPGRLARIILGIETVHPLRAF
jgi:flagellar biosynthesis protein FlhF